MANITTTLKGSPTFVYLGSRKDTYGGKSRSSMTLYIDKAQAEALNAQVKEALEDLPKARRAAAKKPIKKTEDGRLFVKLATTRDVKVFDSKAKLIPLAKLDKMRFGDGTIMKVKASVAAYDNETAGVGLYLNSVMVVKYVEYAGGGGGFGADDIEDDGDFSVEDTDSDGDFDASGGDEEQSEADRLGDQEDDDGL